MKPIVFGALAACALLSGCANVTTGSLTQPLDSKPSVVCIVRNPEVKITAALPYLQKAFARRGIESEVCDKREDCQSPWTLDYEFRRSWDMTTYLSSGDLVLYEGTKIVATANYSAGSWTLTKWGRTEERIDGLVAKLLGEPIED